MSDIKFSCSNCKQHIRVHVSYVGDQVLCPNCEVKLTIPAPGVEGARLVSPTATASSRGMSKGLKVGIAAGLVVVVIGVTALLFMRGDVDSDSQTADSSPMPLPSPQASGAAAGNEPASPNVEPGAGAMAGMDPSMNPDMAMGMGMGMGMNNAPVEAGTARPGGNPWPQWRGPNRDGISTETGLLKQWPADGPSQVWKAVGCGRGFSTVVVSGGRVFTMGDGADGSFMHCFEEATGNRIWTSPRIGNTGGDFVGPKSTPCVDGDRVYGVGQFGDAVCLEAPTGREIWRKQLMRELGGQHSQWNYADSPLVDGDRLIVSPGGSRGVLAALNKDTGALIWQSRQWTDEVQYVSPIVSELGGRRHYISMTQQTLAGVDAQTGQLVWRTPRAGATAVIPTPVIHNNLIFVTSGYGVGCHAFEINGSGGRYAVRQVYANKEMVNHHGGVLLIDGFLYGHSDRGGWKCLDVATGEVKWNHMGVGKGAVVYADGHLYCRAEAGSGNVALVEATSSGYVEKGRFGQPDRSNDNSWAHPVIANGRLYLRDQDVLLAYDVRE